MMHIKAKTLKLIGALMLIMGLAFTCAIAFAAEARDISEACRYTVRSASKATRLYDGKYTTKWKSNKIKSPNIAITTAEPAYGLYICFATMPEAYEIQVEKSGGWETLIKGDPAYLHTYIALPGLKSFRLIAPSEKPIELEINQLRVFSEGDVPADVQLWEPTPEKADLMILVAHPDDELIFMGGMIPTYAVEREMNVVVVYMTPSNTTRSSELLNGLWSMGYRHYPVIGPFGDMYAKDKERAYRIWDAKKARAFVMEAIRKYKPEVLVTHDEKGEYGHGMHMACAELALFCAKNGDNAAIEPELYEKYGGFAPKKVYMHLYPKNEITLDWRVPLEKLGGKTGLDLAQEAYALHITQRNTEFEVLDSGKYSNALFGLALSSVGPDALLNDLMENIEGKGEMTYVPPAAVKKEGEPMDPALSPAWKAVWLPEAGERNEKGFLAQGEYVYENMEEGLWFYATATLVVCVERISDQEKVRTRYEASIFCDLESDERVGTMLYTPDAPGKTRVQATKIAAENQLVFGMNTDYYTYRSASRENVGIVIRNGEILYSKTIERGKQAFPTLDTLAMFPNGQWEVYYCDEFTAEEYSAMGAFNVFSFGPFLVRDGELNTFIQTLKFGRTAQPRCALGIIEPGYYYAALEEGRIPREAGGVSLQELADHMLEKGCVNALNMDGGQTAVFTFMGKQISRIGKYETGPNLPRATSELIYAGKSGLIDPFAQ